MSTDFTPEQEIQALKDENDILKINFTVLESRIDELEQQVSGFLEKQVKKTRSENNSRMWLETAKSDFLESEPERRTDPFTDHELVFWSSYVLRDTPRKEKLTAFSEIGKRAKRIKELVKFFSDKYSGHLKTEKEKDAYARQLIKAFLQHFLTRFTTFGKEGKPNNFWVATSDWAINNYSQNIEMYQQISHLPDESLD